MPTTPLHEAAGNDQYAEVVRLTTQFPDMIHSKGSDYGETPLLEAAFLGRAKICKHLVLVGSDVDAADRFMENPLIVSSRNGHLGVVSVLVDAGANLEARCRKGMTPLLHAAEGGRPALEPGTEIHQLDTMCRLVNAGADMEATAANGTTLMDCANRSSMDNFAAKIWLALFADEFKWSWPDTACVAPAPRHYSMSRDSVRTVLLLAKRFDVKNVGQNGGKWLPPEIWYVVVELLRGMRPRAARKRWSELGFCSRDDFHIELSGKIAEKREKQPYLTRPEELDSDLEWEWSPRWNSPPLHNQLDAEVAKEGCLFIRGATKRRRKRGLAKGVREDVYRGILPPKGLAPVEPGAFAEAAAAVGGYEVTGYDPPTDVARDLNKTMVGIKRYGAPQAWANTEAMALCNAGAGIEAMATLPAAMMVGFCLLGHAIKQLVMDMNSGLPHVDASTGQNLTPQQRKFQLERDCHAAANGMAQGVIDLYTHAEIAHAARLTSMTAAERQAMEDGQQDSVDLNSPEVVQELLRLISLQATFGNSD